MKRKLFGLLLILMVVGFAAVSTTLYLNGSTLVRAYKEDFRVYYSDAKVNGVQDLTVVTDETHLTFTTTLDTLGETYVLDYDVTNGSKNYDAALTMVCTGGNDYLSVTNEFDTSANLEALQTRSGKLTLKLSKSYTGDDLDVSIRCTISGTAVERTSLGEGEAAKPLYPSCEWIYSDTDNSGDISIGDKYQLCNESFNVISLENNNVKLFASKVIDQSFKQTNSTNSSGYGRVFSKTPTWENVPGPKEVDVFEHSKNGSRYLNGYKDYLINVSGISEYDVDLITFGELSSLGCDGTSDYAFKFDLTCENSGYADWLLNGQMWWTKSTSTGTSKYLWIIKPAGTCWTVTPNTGNVGFRPVVTVPMNLLNQ